MRNLVVIPGFPLGNPLRFCRGLVSLLLKYRRKERKKREGGRTCNNLKEKLPLNSSLFQVPCSLGSILGQNTTSLAKGRAKPESLVRMGNSGKISDKMDGGLFLIWTNVKSISSSVPKPPTSWESLISCQRGNSSWEAVFSSGTCHAWWLAVLWSRSHRVGRQLVGGRRCPPCDPGATLPSNTPVPLCEVKTCVLTFVRLLLVGERCLPTSRPGEHALHIHRIQSHTIPAYMT